MALLESVPTDRVPHAKSPASSVNGASLAVANVWSRVDHRKHRYTCPVGNNRTHPPLTHDCLHTNRRPTGNGTLRMFTDVNGVALPHVVAASVVCIAVLSVKLRFLRFIPFPSVFAATAIPISPLQKKSPGGVPIGDFA